MLHYVSVIFGSAVAIVMNRQGDHCYMVLPLNAGEDEEDNVGATSELCV